MSYGVDVCNQLGGARGASAPAQLNSPVGSQISILRGEVDSLEGVIGDLQGRLAPVLQPNQDLKNVCSESPPAAGYGDCEIEQAVANQRERVAMLCRRLSDIVNRLRV
jgi:hypothetical protein